MLRFMWYAARCRRMYIGEPLYMMWQPGRIQRMAEEGGVDPHAGTSRANRFQDGVVRRDKSSSMCGGGRSARCSWGTSPPTAC